MGVKGCGARGFKLFGRQERFQPISLCRPLLVARIEDLWQATPSDVADQNPFLIVYGRTFFLLKLLEEGNRFEIAPALLFQ
jgi:hypothetical protein